MARIRTIKPEFPQSESMGRVSREARLCFIMIWTICDDAGRVRGSSRLLASLLFPYDAEAGDMIDGWLEELEAEDCIRRYQIGTDTYLESVNWLKHQKIDKPSPSRLPPFVESSRIVVNVREEEATDLVPSTVDLKKDLPAGTGLSVPKKIPEDFEKFWKDYPTDKNMPKKAALKQWLRLTPEKRVAAIGAIPGFLRYCSENKWYRPIYADRFLSQEKFEGYAGEKVQTEDEIVATLDRRDKLLKQGKYAPRYQ